MNNTPVPLPTHPIRFLDRLRAAIREHNLSYRTEKSYVRWTIRYINFHNKRHPKEMGDKEIQAFLTHLREADNAAPATRKTASSALTFLYRHFLKRRAVNLHHRFHHYRRDNTAKQVLQYH